MSDWSISSIEIKSSGIKGVISKEVVESLIETLWSELVELLLPKEVPQKLVKLCKGISGVSSWLISMKGDLSNIKNFH